MSNTELCRVNIYFVNGKSLGFINIDLKSENPESILSKQLQDVIEAFSNRETKDALMIEDGRAIYYIDIYQIAYIEVLYNR